MFASLHPYIGLRVREIARGDLIMEPGRRVNSFVVNFRVQSADTAEGIGVFRRLFFFAGLPASVCDKGKDRVPGFARAQRESNHVGFCVYCRKHFFRKALDLDGEDTTPSIPLRVS